MIHTAELWRFNAVTGPTTVNDEIGTPIGPREAVRVPASARRHYCWIAAGASLQGDDADHWWCVGHLEFKLGSSKVGEFHFTDHSRIISAAERAAAPRQLIRARGDASGSTQPVLRWQDTAAAGVIRDNLDVAAFCFEIQCDEVIYVMDRNYYTITSVYNLLHFVTGLRVLSM